MSALMVKEKRLKDYFNKRWQAILKNLDTLCTVSDSEALHDLRLNAKKVKGLTDLLKSSSKHPKNFSTKLIRPLFQQTGAIRIADLNLKTLKEYQFQNKNLELEQNSIIDRGYKLLSIEQ